MDHATLTTVLEVLEAILVEVRALRVEVRELRAVMERGSETAGSEAPAARPERPLRLQRRG